MAGISSIAIQWRAVNPALSVGAGYRRAAIDRSLDYCERTGLAAPNGALTASVSSTECPSVAGAG